VAAPLWLRNGSQAKQGRLVVLGIKARQIHHLGPQLPLGQRAPQEWQGHRQGGLESCGRRLQPAPLGLSVLRQAWERLPPGDF